MKRILALSLALLLLISLAGCAEPDPIVGTWTGEIDDANRINQLLEDTYGTEMAQYWKVETFPVTIQMTFRRDGTYSQTVDNEKLNASMDQLKQVLSAGLTAFLEDLIAASNTDITVEALMQQLNISVDDLMNSAFSEKTIGEVENEYTFEGKYKTEDGKLYTSTGPDINVDENWYETYEISEDTLTLLTLVCTLEDQTVEQDRYPITLTRAE